MMSPPARERMSALEIRASASLASLFALRMLGLFLILPVFAVHAQHLPGGDNHLLVGIALGAYGLTQGILQIPAGMAADRWGRKRIIVIGLVLFAVGSFVAAGAHDIAITILGRAIQGTGAISAAVMALAADLTREQHRTKAMAAIGGSIGITFAVSLSVAPALYRVIGMGGIFFVTGLLALAGIWATLVLVPKEPREHLDLSRRVEPASLGSVLRNPSLLRLNFGIFALHSMQMAIFIVVPLALVKYADVPVGSHWKIYLPVVIGSFVLMIPPIIWAERGGKLKAVFIGSIALMLLVQAAGFLWKENLTSLVVLLFGFFLAFNVLEAMLPSLISRIAPVAARGTAIGVFNTTQALGLFAGGAAGGAIMQHFGENAVFVFGMAIVALWLVIALPMPFPGRVASRTFEVRGQFDPVALRDQLLCLRGVREAVIIPERREAKLTFHPENFDEGTVRKLLGGEA